jgi:hypothetical protein
LPPLAICVSITVMAASGPLCSCTPFPVQTKGGFHRWQRDPASDAPLIIQVNGMPDASLIYGYQVDFMFQDWIRSLPVDIPRVTLTEFVRRIDNPGEIAQGPLQGSEEADNPLVKTRNGEAECAVHEMDWTAARVRKLIAEMAKAVGMSVEQFFRDAELQRCGELQDRRADHRRRRGEVRRRIKKLELQQQDLLVEQTIPDIPRLDLMIRYESAALRKRDKSLKLLLELQARRMIANPVSKDGIPLPSRCRHGKCDLPIRLTA